MDNDSLKNFKMSGELLFSLLSIYKLIGREELYLNQFDDREPFIKADTIAKDCFTLNSYFDLCSNKDRTRLILTKDSEPRNSYEKQLKGLKDSLVRLRKFAEENDSIYNSVDILDALKLIFSKDISFSNEKFDINNPRKSSRRHLFEEAIDEYNEAFTNKTFEPITLSCMLLMKMFNLRPFSKQNEAAFILSYYYLLLKAGVHSFKYVSFMDIYLENRKEIEKSIAFGSVNFDSGTLYYNEFIKMTIKIITLSYNKLDEIYLNIKQENRALKKDNIQKTIMEDLPTIFSKEDVKKYYPNASDSTIIRALNSLKEKKYIMPIGTGRSAKWQKLVNPNDAIYLFGDSYDESEK